MSKYNPDTTIIFFENDEGGIAMCSPSGELPTEVVAVRDLPAGTPYWIIDFKTREAQQQAFPDGDFFDAFELDKEYFGDPHGVALGIVEWSKQQPEGTPGKIPTDN